MNFRESRNKTQFIFTAVNSARQRFLKKQDAQSQKQQNYIQLGVRPKSVKQQHRDEEEQEVFDLSVIKKKYYPQFEDQDKNESVMESPMKQSTNAYGQVLQKEQKKEIGNPEYNVWDLTYTFISLQINFFIIGFAFLVLLIIRYYTLAILIYIAIVTKVHVDWIVVVILARILYFILVVKVSLKTPESKTEIVLKRHWNSKQSDVSEVFQIIDSKMLLVSILRGIIPAQLSFFYINASHKRKQFQIYAAINYIYASIQCIVYYPFIIIYLEYVHHDEFHLKKYQQLTLIIAIFGFGIILLFSFLLFMIGIHKRHGKLCFCCS